MFSKIGSWTRKNALCILTFYFAVSFVFSDFGISAVVGASVLCTLLAAGIFEFIYSGDLRKKTWDRVDLLLALFLVVLIVNILRTGSISRDVAYYSIITAASFCFIWITKSVDESQINTAKLILIIVASLAALLNLIHLFFPDIISNYVLPVLTETSCEYYERISSEGYGFALGENVGYTECLMVMGVAVISLSMNRRNFLLLLPCFYLVIFGMCIMQRRGELLICTIVLVLVTVLRIIRLRKANGTKDSFKLWELLAVTAIQVLLVALAFSAVNTLIENSRLENFLNSVSKIEAGQLDVDELGNGRLVLWQLAWDGFLERPVFGNGWGSYAFVAPLSGNTHAHNAHCVYLQLLYETGGVGFLIIGAVFMILLAMTVRQAIRMKRRRDMRNMLLGTFVILYALGEGVFDNSLYYPYIMLLFSGAVMILFRSGNYDGHAVFTLSKD